MSKGPTKQEALKGWNATVDKNWELSRKFDEALKLAIAEHDWRRGYSGPCPPRVKCPSCKLIKRLLENR